MHTPGKQGDARFSYPQGRLFSLFVYCPSMQFLFIYFYYLQAPPSVPVVASALQERFIVAAIDFGTTFSGYAYSFYHDFREDPLRITTNHWTSKAAGVCIVHV